MLHQKRVSTAQLYWNIQQKLQQQFVWRQCYSDSAFYSELKTLKELPRNFRCALRLNFICLIFLHVAVFVLSRELNSFSRDHYSFLYSSVVSFLVHTYAHTKIKAKIWQNSAFGIRSRLYLFKKLQISDAGRHFVEKWETAFSHTMNWTRATTPQINLLT